MTLRGIGLFLAAAAFAGGSVAAPARAQDEPIEGDSVVARVGGDEILFSEIVGAVYSLPEDTQAKTPFDELYAGALQRRIDGQLVFRAAIAAGLRDTRAHAQAMAAFERRTLADAWLRREVAMRVSEGSARARYDEILADASGRTELRARRIVAADAEEAQRIYARIAAGEDFAEVARASVFPGADRGGDLGWFSEGAMLPAIVAVARGLAPGQVSAPFPTEFGWHLLKLEGARPLSVPPYDELQESILRRLRDEAVGAVLAELREATPVQRFDRDGSPLE